jgi:hypothetical protein
VWLDIFAINQDDAGGVFSAMKELQDGKTLADVIALSRATKVILDRARVVPLSRLWYGKPGAWLIVIAARCSRVGVGVPDSLAVHWIAPRLVSVLT